jgi:hypothetical protein
MTNREYPEFTDGIYKDGVWTSWDWIYHQSNEQELQPQYPDHAIFISID